MNDQQEMESYSCLSPPSAMCCDKRRQCLPSFVVFSNSYWWHMPPLPHTDASWLTKLKTQRFLQSQKRHRHGKQAAMWYERICQYPVAHVWVWANIGLELEVSTLRKKTVAGNDQTAVEILQFWSPQLSAIRVAPAGRVGASLAPALQNTMRHHRLGPNLPLWAFRLLVLYPK